MFIFFPLNIRSLPFDEFVRRAAEETHKEFFLSEVKGIFVIDWQLAISTEFQPFKCGHVQCIYPKMEHVMILCQNLFFIFCT